MSSRRKTFHASADLVADTCHVVRLRAFTRVISRLYNAALSSAELTISQFNILTAIVKLDPAAPRQISAILHIEKSSLSRNINLMRKNGWVSTDGKGRALRVSITAKGKRVYEKAVPLWENAQRKTRQLVGKEIFRQINSAVDSFRKK